MPELDFKGKEFVRNHHLVVPYHPLIADAEKSVGEPDLDGNLIIQGDNLHALKSLLPKYAGKVDCIFIDPPYNTGNEGWSYNDNVNSPELKAWFKNNPVGVDDGLRHDKWCCMMWPRLRLLWELLAENGILLVCIDEIELHHLQSLLAEIAGPEKHFVTFAWQTKVAARGVPPASMVIPNVEYVVAFCKGDIVKLKGEVRTLADFTDDGDPRGMWRSESLRATGKQNNYFSIVDPETGTEFFGNWAFAELTIKSMVDDDLIIFPSSADGTPRQKKFFDSYRNETKAITSFLGWHSTEVGTKQLMELFEGHKLFDFPKPLSLVSTILSQILLDKNSLILDSFAGSGTTAHAVLKMNAQDGGNRKFILVEMEDYADSLTAERVRRVINGYPYQGTQRETLLERKLTWSEIKKADTLLEEVKNTEATYKDQFDKITTKLEKGVLKVTGERNVKEKAPGLGGSFTYCTLGEPLEIEKLLDPEGSLPAFDSLAEWLRHTAGAGDKPVPITGLDAELAEWSLGRHSDVAYWLIYRPDREFLTSPDAALTLDLARRIAKTAPGRHRVFSAAKYVGAKVLRDEKIEIDHVPLPFTLFRGNR